MIFSELYSAYYNAVARIIEAAFQPGVTERDLQRHVLEIMTSFTKSCEEKRYIPLESRYTPTEPMKNNPIHGILD